MGNRANIIFANEKLTDFSPVIYLHWNGGLESIVGFVEVMKRNIGNRDNDEVSRQAACFVSTVCICLDDVMSARLDDFNGKFYAFSDIGDNGLLIIVSEGQKNDTYYRPAFEGEDKKVSFEKVSEAEVEAAIKEGYGKHWIEKYFS